MTLIENTVTELLQVLDQDIRHMQTTLTWLSQLREFVISRQDVALQQLLEQIQSATGFYRDNETRRNQLRQSLAQALDRSLEEVTLSRLEDILSGPLQAQVSRIKIQLQVTIQELQSDHTATVMFLSDCARFNRILLQSLLGETRQDTVTYTQRGATENGVHTSLVNMQF